MWKLSHDLVTSTPENLKPPNMAVNLSYMEEILIFGALKSQARI